MESTAELLQSVEAIYDTILDPSRWVDALDRTAAAAGAFGSMLMVRDPLVDALEIHVASSRINASETRTYVETLLSADELRWDGILEKAPAMTVFHDEDIWPERGVYEAMPSQKWLQSWNLDHRSAVRLSSHRGWKDTLALIYPTGRPGMRPDEHEKLAPLLPHLSRATEIRRPFTLLRRRYQAILSMLDRLGIGVVVLLDDDSILLANVEAERILDAGDGLRRRSDGRLGMPVGAASEADSLRRALHELRSGARQDGTTVYLGRGLDREPYVVDLVAFRESGAEFGEPLSGALLCMIDPENREVISTRGLARVYGLTEAEAAVCALMGEGRSNREIADERGVSIDTVKAQTKAILRKTLCANRVDLVRRALSIAPPLLDDQGRRDDEAS